MSKRFIIAILALFMAGVAFAQLVPTSQMSGKVVDNTGAPLPGVSVEATSPRLVGKATAVTDGDGNYRLFSLPSGVYEVTFTLQGFQTLIRKDIVIQLSQQITLNATLNQAALEEQVTVIGQSPLIDVKSTVKSQTMTKEVFMALPRNRSFDGLVSTIPGVQYDNRTGGLSVDGATGTENMWYMDGADITQPHIGTNAQGAVMELVDEVKVTASGYNAEFGGSMGGVVNVITRSGGNAYHGDVSFYYNDNTQFMQGKAREYFRWSPLNSNIPEYVNDDDLYWQGGRARDDYKRFEGVFTLGGYILKDKLWFFGSVNPVYSRTYAQRFFNSDDTNPDPTIVSTAPVLPLLQQEPRLQRPGQADRRPRQRAARVGLHGQQLVELPWRHPLHPRLEHQGLRLRQAGIRLSELVRRLPGRLQRQQQFPRQPPRRLPYDEHEQPADREPLHDLLLQQ